MLININMNYDIGNKFCEALDSTKIKLSGEDDGRTESLNSEKEVTNCIGEKCSQIPGIEFLPKKDNRAFGDITVLINGIEYHINVKMINYDASGTYNGGGPSVFNFVLFGKKTTTWVALQKRVKENKPLKCVKKYYYLIYFKNSDKKSIFCSLGDLARESIQPNPSNPIQLRKDIKLVKRTPEEEAKFIIELFEEVMFKRAEPYLKYTGAIA